MSRVHVKRLLSQVSATHAQVCVCDSIELFKTILLVQLGHGLPPERNNGHMSVPCVQSWRVQRVACTVCRQYQGKSVESNHSHIE